MSALQGREQRANPLLLPALGLTGWGILPVASGKVLAFVCCLDLGKWGKLLWMTCKSREPVLQVKGRSDGVELGAHQGN